MPQTKQQLLDEARKLGLKVEATTKMADLRSLIKEATDKKAPVVKEEVAKETVAKAGKRSSKALKEAEELAEKKAKATENEVKPTTAANSQKSARSRLERRSKAYRAIYTNIEPGKAYPIDEAIGLAKTTSPVKFDASVELHINLNVDPRQAEQNIRDNVTLPAGNGKKIRIAALTDDPKTALAAGADIAGNDELLQQIDKGELNFDILIATPALMPKLGKYAKSLGPKGLMPNPKRGTVTPDVKKAIEEAKAGRVEYRVDSTGIVHLGVGKISFTSDDLKSNIMTVINSVKGNKPSSVKSNYMKAVYLSTSMGPSVIVDSASLNES
jgi:large subunit ribosomal protein L1